jgi:hypothetical protein
MCAMDTAACSRRLREQFPELISEFDDPTWIGLLHLELSVLARFAEQAITRREYSTLQRCYGFAAQALAEGDPTVTNAIAVSFLENILLAAQTPEQCEAERRLPEILRAELVELRAHWERLSVEARKHER